MKKIVLTGGGTAGHVTPHFALIPHLRKEGWEIHYIGTYEGIEKDLVGDKLPYHSISAGKFRRYFDLKNFTDPFRVLKGVWDAWAILRQIRPQVIFSKGGFVTVPVTVAAWSLGIPVVLHESDLTPGLANRLSLPFSQKLCLTFPDSLEQAKGKGIVTGTPIRPELFNGSRERGLALCGWTGQMRTLLVMGGSLGSAILNQTIRKNLAALTKQYRIIHLCGRGNLDPAINNRHYFQLEYAQDEMPDLLAASDLVLSRAGANSIFELVALGKPNILVPLSLEASRGDQILNAQSFARQGFSLVIQEEDLSIKQLLEHLDILNKNYSSYVNTMKNSKIGDGTINVLKVIQAVVD